MFTISFILDSIKLHLNKTSPNIGILPHGVLRPKLLNNPFASCLFINLDFLIPHISHLDNKIDLPLLATKTFGFIFSVFFYTLNNKITLFLYLY